MYFEQGPILPPSEAESLLIRLTRNCPWNKCLFCPVYKSIFPESTEEIKNDILAIKRQKKRSGCMSFAWREWVTREVLQLVYDHERNCFILLSGFSEEERTFSAGCRLYGHASEWPKKLFLLKSSFLLCSGLQRKSFKTISGAVWNS